ncbi:MAG: hypothetical protein IPJ89_03745 [Candidatus Iainarchaeum archaeon]|uniref:Uncharacterized protein n=1 Tax=Candidatus Iainarchaeum sp. TaxID=3101447 RepID=A0A7T9DJ11_9ARCH|nr:MAG: hypothetical protein IPJ89_03745 [Candidatus Diapherotrites archaeon]
MPFRLRLPFWPKKKDYSKKKPLKEPKTRVGKAWRKTLPLRRNMGLATKRAAYVFVLFHAITNALYFGNYAFNKLYPSEIRREFARTHGIELQGWRSDIEQDLEMIPVISEAVQRERVQGDFSLGWFKIESDAYWKKHFVDQASQWLFKGHSGYAMLNHISAKKGSGRSWMLRELIHHEIKHIKAYAIAEKHPEFESEWKKISTDEKGNSIYLSTAENAKYWLKLINSDEVRAKLEQTECLRLGFITPYARTHLREDIAELGEATEEPSRWPFFHGVLNGETSYPRIAAKIRLAQRYGLIPPEFSEMVRLDDYSRSLTRAYHGSNEPKYSYSDFMRDSQRFLQRYPMTVYEEKIRSERAWFMAQNTTTESGLQAALREYEKVLRCRSKSTTYVSTLKEMGEIYTRLDDFATTRLFRQAEEEYWRRFSAGDPRLAVRGVNDFLEKNGLLR